VDVGCATGEYAWSVLAKQANRFKGSPGNDFVLTSAPEDLATTVTGGCKLLFAAQPQDARVGERLSAADFDPAGPPVLVEVVDGAGNPLTSSAPTITLALATTSGLGMLHGGTTRTAAAGVAAFGDLSVDAPGTYSLQASAPGLQPAVSAFFTIQQVAIECREDVDCSGSLSTPLSRVDASAFAGPGTDDGFLQLSFNAGFQPDCAGYEEASADTAFVLGPDRQKRVVYSIDKKVMNAIPDNGASSLQICFAAPFTFATRAGRSPQGGRRQRQRDHGLVLLDAARLRRAAMRGIPPQGPRGQRRHRGAGSGRRRGSRVPGLASGGGGSRATPSRAASSARSAAAVSACVSAARASSATSVS
jgi:hypothetical protein